MVKRERIFLFSDSSDLHERLLSVSGVAADAKVGSELIKVTAVDHDIGNNSVITYLIVTIQYIRLQSNETEDMGDIFLIGTHILHTGLGTHVSSGIQR